MDNKLNVLINKRRMSFSFGLLALLFGFLTLGNGAYGQCVDPLLHADSCDLDGDGVINIDDLDDDNDGILDVNEFSSLQYLNSGFSNGLTSWNAVGVASKVNAAVVDLTIVGALSQDIACSNPIVRSFSFDVGWNNGFGAGSVDNSILRVTFGGTQYLSIRTPLGGGSNADNAPDQGGDAMVSALNGATFVIDNPSNQGPQFIDHSPYLNWNYVTVTVTLPSAILSSEIQIDVNAFVDDFGIDNILIVDGFCGIDTDGDNILNHLDIDSDGDGCNDAVEAGHIDLDRDGEVDGSGYDAVTGQVTGAATSYTGTLPVVRDANDATACCNPSTSGYPDSDGDNVTDFCDLDDDNDGILSLEESPFVAVMPTSLSTGNITSFGNTSNVTLSGPMLKNFDTSLNRFLLHEGSGIVSVGDTLTMEFSQGINDITIGHTSVLNNNIMGDYTVTLANGDVHTNLPIAFISNNAHFSIITFGGLNAVESSSSGSGQGECILEFPTLKGIIESANSPVAKIEYRLLRLSSGSFTQGLVIEVQLWDTDNDGIPNYLDIDSDGDGCNDAVEAGHIDVDGDGEVDGSGYDASTGQVTGAATSYTGTLPAVIDVSDATACCNVSASGFADNDNDGVSDNCDLDDDNDGILGINEGCVTDIVPMSPSLVGNSFTSVTASGISVTTTCDAITNRVDTGDRIDNDNFTFLSGVSSLVGRHVLFKNQAGSPSLSGLNIPLTLTFSGGDPVNEVYLHANSVDHVDIQMLAASNPNIGVQVLSGENLSIVYAGGDFLIGDDDSKTRDHTTADEVADHGGSADFTVRFYAVNPSIPITTLNLRLKVIPGTRYSSSELLQIAFEVGACEDTDGDNLPNHLDIDSDGDGCNDAVEAGHIDVDGNGEVDGSGYDAVTGQVTGAATSYTGTLPAVIDGSDATACCNVSVSGHPDLDNDGLSDNCDLDDDNDGILDCAESYSGVVGMEPVIIGTDLPLLSSSNNYVTYTGSIVSGLSNVGTFNGVAGDGNGSFGLEVFGDNSTGATYEMNISNPMNIRILHTTANPAGLLNAIDRITFDSDVAITLNNPAGHLEVWDANNSTWTSPTTLTTRDSILFRPSGTFPIGGTGTFSFAMEGASRFTYKQVSTVPNAANGSSFLMEVDCSPIDTDGDNLPNHLDIDSDGDGCNDAVEAGHIDIDGDGEVDGSGYDAVTGQVTGAVTSYTGTLPAVIDANDATACCNVSVSGHPDNDNDGVSDNCDLDDDNDGILSLEESPFVAFVTTSLNTGTITSFGNTSNITLSGPMLKGFDTSSNRFLLHEGSGIVSVGDKLTMEFSHGINDITIGHTSVKSNYIMGDYTVTLANGNVHANLPIAFISNNANFNIITSGGLNAVASSGGQGDGVLEFPTLNGIVESANSPVTKIEYTLLTVSSGSFTQGMVVEVQLWDTDNDGTPNYFDIDSDGDGCNDAVEAGHIDIDGDGEVDGSGYDAVTGQVTGAATSYTGILPAVIDGSDATACCNVSVSGHPDLDNDGLSDNCDLDDDNDGILDCAESYSGVVGMEPVIVGTDLPLLSSSSNYVTYTGSIVSGLSNVGTFKGVAGDGNGSFGLEVFGDNSTGATYEMSISNPMNIRILHTTANPAGLLNAIDRITFDSDVAITLNNPAGHLEVWDANNSTWTSPTTLTTRDSILFRPSGTFPTGGTGTFSFAMEGASRFTYKQVSTVPNAANGSSFLMEVDCSPIDTDGDNIPNHLDIDSDGDGCNDAVEAGHIDIDGNGEVDGSGYDAVTGQVTGAATSYTGTLPAVIDGSDATACCNVSVSGFSDADNDGVSDNCDLDDDNDGILDCTESYSGVVGMEPVIVGADLPLLSSSSNYVTYTGSIVSGLSNVGTFNGVAGDGNGSFGLEVFGDNSTGATYEMSISNPMNIRILHTTANPAGILNAVDRVTFDSDVAITLNNPAGHLEVWDANNSTWTSPTTLTTRDSILFRPSGTFPTGGTGTFSFAMEGASRFTYKQVSTVPNAANGSSF